MIEHVVSHLADGRNIGQAVSLAFMFILLFQFVVYARLDRAHIALFIPPIVITIEGIAFYTYVLATKPPPSESITTLSWLLRFQVIVYAVFLMKYLNRKKRIDDE